MIRQQIAERLRKARAESGLTLRDVAAAVPDDLLSHGTIFNYEQGKSAPTVEALCHLAVVYERDLAWFLPLSESLL